MYDRAKRWNDNYLEKELEKLSPRIQKDLENTTPPKIDKVESTYLWGGVGSGKTIQAVRMMLYSLKDNYIDMHPIQTIFTTVPELLFEIKNSYSTKEGVTEEELVKKYSEISLLVLDDFGVERTSDWSFQLLFIIINRRYENMKMTIFTSNFNLTELAEKLGDDRIPSRIQQMCKIIKSKDINYRARK